MKNRNFKNRLVAVSLAILMCIATLAGCTANSQNQELAELLGIETNRVTGEAQLQETSCEELQEQFDSLTETVETLIDKMEDEATDSAKALQEAKSEIENLKQENQELKAQVVPAVEVIDDTVYCDIDYFLERAIITFDDGTSALMAIEEGDEVMLDDIHAVDTRGNYRDKAIDLPLKDNKIAITFDSVEVKNATFGTKTIVYSNAMKTGYQLVEVTKEEWDEELQLVAVCVPNPEAEYDYDFYVVAKEYVKPTTTVVTKPTTQKPQASKPTVIPLPKGDDDDDEDDDDDDYIPSTSEPEDAPEHNDRPSDDGDSTQNPETDGTEVEKPKEDPEHNQRPGQGESDGDSTKNPESDGTVVELPAHNDKSQDRGTQSSSSNSGNNSTQKVETNGTVVEGPSHSARPS